MKAIDWWMSFCWFYFIFKTKIQQYNFVIGEKPTFGEPINFSNELYAAISVVFSVLSSVQSEVANTALIYSHTADLTERRGAKGLS